MVVTSLVHGMKPSCTVDGSEPRHVHPTPAEDSVAVRVEPGNRLRVALYLPASSFCKTVVENDYAMEEA